MTRIVDIVHSDKDRNLWILHVDDVEPSTDSRGFVQEGGFFVEVKTREGRAVIKLSDKEVIDLANRLIEAYKVHIRRQIELYKDSSRQRRTRTQRENNEIDDLVNEAMDEDLEESSH
jgi:hypothetical protein